MAPQVKFSLAAGTDWSQSKCLQSGTSTVWGDAQYINLTSNTVRLVGKGFLKFTVNDSQVQTLGGLSSTEAFNVAGFVTFDDSQTVYFVDRLITHNQNTGEIVCFCNVRLAVYDGDFK